MSNGEILVSATVKTVMKTRPTEPNEWELQTDVILMTNKKKEDPGCSQLITKFQSTS